MGSTSGFIEKEKAMTVDLHGGSPSFVKVFAKANLPTFSAYAFGTLTLLTFCATGAAVYALYCVASTVAMWATVCTTCPRYGRMCPCGYSDAAATLFKKGDPHRIVSRYKLIWLYVAPAWLAPPISSIPILFVRFSWPLLVFLAVFMVMAFIVAPALSEVLGCCTYWRGCEAPSSESGGGALQGGDVR